MADSVEESDDESEAEEEQSLLSRIAHISDAAPVWIVDAIRGRASEWAEIIIDKETLNYLFARFDNYSTEDPNAFWLNYPDFVRLPMVGVARLISFACLVALLPVILPIGLHIACISALREAEVKTLFPDEGFNSEALQKAASLGFFKKVKCVSNTCKAMFESDPEADDSKLYHFGKQTMDALKRYMALSFISLPLAMLERPIIFIESALLLLTAIALTLVKMASAIALSLPLCLVDVLAASDGSVLPWDNDSIPSCGVGP